MVRGAAARKRLLILLTVHGRSHQGVACLGVAETTGGLHHVELWVPDLGRAIAEWGWLLSRLGYVPFQDWQHGHSWRLGDTYIVVEQSPAMTGVEHDRRHPGLNHLAFHAGNRQDVDSLAADGPARGWAVLFADKHPYAGGPGHYAAYLSSTDGFEVELVADE
jgi:catechol 2,3-dioxygenase-like lactoylglutathione lyase family enzyme